MKLFIFVVISGLLGIASARSRPVGYPPIVLFRLGNHGSGEFGGFLSNIQLRNDFPGWEPEEPPADIHFRDDDDSEEDDEDDEGSNTEDDVEADIQDSTTWPVSTWSEASYGARREGLVNPFK